MMKMTAVYKIPNKSEGAKISDFRNVLYEYINDPFKYKNVIFKQTNECIVIYDLYPKATVHLLIIPKPDFLHIKSIDMTETSMTSKLQVIDDLATSIINSDIIQNYIKEKFPVSYQNIRFKTGYHAVPTLHPLHCHIISDDFKSDALTNKKHWNSFTTDFFITSSSILSLFNQKPPISIEAEVESRKMYELSPLQCHRCAMQCKSIPFLKKHIECCVCEGVSDGSRSFPSTKRSITDVSKEK